MPLPEAETPRNEPLPDAPRARDARDAWTLAAWIAVAIIVVARLATFWGLHYGQSDDISTDYHFMAMGGLQAAYSSAIAQSRIYFLPYMPLYSLMMRIGGTPWYDIINLGTFAVSALLPVAAFRKYFTTTLLQLYAVSYFAALPLAFAYRTPYMYPIQCYPLVACLLAIVLFDSGQEADPASGSHWRLALGGLFTFIAVCGYELLTLTSLFLFACYFYASRNGGALRSLWRRRDFQVAAAAVLVYSLCYVSFRLVYPPSYAGVQPASNLSLADMIRVVFTLSATSSIFAWSALPQPLIYVDYASGFQQADTFSASFALSRLIQLPFPVLAVAVLTALLTFYLVAKPGKQRLLDHPLALLALVVGLLFTPNVVFGLVPKISTLVLNGSLTGYTGTAYSHMGFAFLPVLIAGLALRSKIGALRVFTGVVLALILGWASLSATDFNTVSARYARRQASKWQVPRYLSSCSTAIPSRFLTSVVAPRMWNFSTGSISRGDRAQETQYWDMLFRTRYGMSIHLMEKPPAVPGPVTMLDYHLDSDGDLESVVLGRAQDGKAIQDVIVIKPAFREDRASISESTGDRITAPQRAGTVCEDGLEAVLLHGHDLRIETLHLEGLPYWAPRPVAVEAARK